MSITRFRAAAAVLIAFNIAGTVLTWAAHLSKPGTSNAHAIAQGTEFTGPIIFIAIWTAATAATMAATRFATIGTWVMTLFAVVYCVGDITELAKKNVGVSSAKWHAILGLDVVGLALGLSVVALGVVAIVERRRRGGVAPELERYGPARSS